MNSVKKKNIQTKNLFIAKMKFIRWYNFNLFFTVYEKNIICYIYFHLASGHDIFVDFDERTPTKKNVCRNV